MWIVGGNHNGSVTGDVWKSADGTNWTLTTSGNSIFSQSRALVFECHMWVQTGSNISKSKDG